MASHNSGIKMSPGSLDVLSEKVSSNTLKRHPKMDLNKTDMLQLLSYLEGELQARDITIAALQAEKAKQFLYQAKYGRFGLVDPLHALQRDSELCNDTSFDEAAVKAMYDDQLMQLENLITTQQKSQQQMREQLTAVEKRYFKTCTELEELKLKHSRDMEQGDNVTYMLEKERERLKQELEYERSQGKKMEKELKKSTGNTGEEDQAQSAKHKQIAIMLIKERVALVEKVLELRQHCAALTADLAAERARKSEEPSSESPQVSGGRRSEAELERKIHECDFEREQLRAKLAKCEAENRELSAELDRLRTPVEQSSSVARVTPPSRHPHMYISERTLSPTPLTNTVVQAKPGTSKLSSLSDSSRPLPASASIPKKQSPDDPSSPRAAPVTRRAPEVSPGNPTQLTRPSLEPRTVQNTSSPNTDLGTRISVSSPGVSAVQQKKLTPVGRGFPPPVPPNKPQVFIPSTTTTTLTRSGQDKVQPNSKTIKDRISFNSPINTDTVSNMNSITPSLVRPAASSHYTS